MAANYSLLKFLSSFDSSKLLDKKSISKLERALEKTGLNIPAQKFASIAINASFFPFLISIIALQLAFNDFSLSIPISMLVFAAALVFAFYLPRSIAKNRAKEIELEMAVALKTAIVELQLNSPFEHVILKIAHGNFGELSIEFKKISREIDSGSNLPEALMRSAQRVDSRIFERAAMNLVFIYETSSKSNVETESLEKITDEIIELQKNSLRDFQAKLSISGLIFVAASCIVPSLYSAYIIIGSQFLELKPTSLEIFLTFAVFFPAINILILLFIKSQTPKTIL